MTTTVSFKYLSTFGIGAVLELLESDLRGRMYEVLRNVFGFRDFRHCQRATVIACLLGESCCVFMPTGLISPPFLPALTSKSRCRKVIVLPVNRSHFKRIDHSYLALGFSDEGPAYEIGGFEGMFSWISHGIFVVDSRRLHSRRYPCQRTHFYSESIASR